MRRPEAPAPVAAAPIKVGPVRAVSVMHGPTIPAPQPAAVGNGTDKVPSLSMTPRTFAVLERAAWVACGALAALVVAYIGVRHKSASSSAMPAAVASQPVATPLAPARNIEPPSLTNDTPEPATFDADLAGRNAAKAARDCFAAERATKTISFGAGLLFAKEEALSRRTYLVARRAALARRASLREQGPGRCVGRRRPVAQHHRRVPLPPASRRKR